MSLAGVDLSTSVTHLGRVGSTNGETRSLIFFGPSPEPWVLLRAHLAHSEQASHYILARPQDPDELVMLGRKLTPAVIIVDQADVAMLPLRALDDLLGEGRLNVLAVAQTAGLETCEELFRLGCAGVLPRDVSLEQFLKALDAIFAGELWLPRKVLSRIARETRHGDGARKLTTREVQIQRLIADGLTNQQIAEQLFISRETVRWHVRSLYAKLGVHARSTVQRKPAGA